MRCTCCRNPWRTGSIGSVHIVGPVWSQRSFLLPYSLTRILQVTQMPCPLKWNTWELRSLSTGGPRFATLHIPRGQLFRRRSTVHASTRADCLSDSGGPLWLILCAHCPRTRSLYASAEQRPAGAICYAPSLSRVHPACDDHPAICPRSAQRPSEQLLGCSSASRTTIQEPPPP